MPTRQAPGFALPTIVPKAYNACRWPTPSFLVGHSNGPSSVDPAGVRVRPLLCKTYLQWRATLRPRYTHGTTHYSNGPPANTRGPPEKNFPAPPWHLFFSGSTPDGGGGYEKNFCKNLF